VHVRLVVRNGSLKLAVALVAVAGCKTYQVGNQPLPTADLDAQSYQPAPGRQVVVGDGGLIGGGGTSGADGGGQGGVGGFGIGGAGGSSDGPRRDAPASPPLDAPVYQPDAGAGCTSCNLLAQNCASGQACYPSGGAACCAPDGVTPEGAMCAEDQGCARGLLCINFLCRALCSIDAPSCPACSPLGGYAGVGYCAP
jgi:hypothetical protein